MQTLTDRIDALLPQTQCTRCGFEGCGPYAQAIARGDAEVNRCPPGGVALIDGLAALLGRDPMPLDPLRGPHRSLRIARVIETECIGCTKCIQACPVDAIVGAPRRMHTVIARLCTGCDLCLPPCPVDCIVMTEPDPPRAWTTADATAARQRHDARRRRMRLEQADTERRLAARARDKLEALRAAPDSPEIERKRRIVEAAIERARQRRLARDTGLPG
ncbi:MAG: electron transport complex subunit RsxB [Burkholderiales bacterium]|nr:MAG: electron transport complex subunit RsxB [Burkholderiales bacterium]